MLYAAHIATLTLALHNPDALFRQNNVFVVPLGTRKHSLGSVEFLRKDSRIPRRLPEDEEGEAPLRYGLKKRSEEELALRPNSFDLVIMNPPFARSCGDNLLFGSIQDSRLRQSMKTRMTELLEGCNLGGIGQAGLGAVFVAVADKYVKTRGRIAFVLPRNLLSGVSWQKIRELLVRRMSNAHWIKGGYHLEFVILSAEPQAYNFSENTDLSETLFVARKLDTDDSAAKTLAVILHRKPRTVFESLALSKPIASLSQQIQKADVFDIASNPNAWPHQLSLGNEIVGRAYSLNSDLIEDNVDNWGRLFAFAYPELTKIVARLRTLKEFNVPGGLSLHIPLKRLTSLVSVGPDRRQIHDSFDQADSGLVRGLWGKDMSMDLLEIEPNTYLTPKSGASPDKLIVSAGHLMIAERIRLNTTPLVALYSREEALSNVWWPAKVDSSVRQKSADAAKILSLWLNSTPGLLLIMAELEVTEGPWTAMKKTTLEQVPVIDLSALQPRQVTGLLELYTTMSRWRAPLLKQQFEEARHGKGWRFSLDTGLLGVLRARGIELQELRPLYELLFQEATLWEHHPR